MSGDDADRMRFVDEYRDAQKARALAARIGELCEPGRSYKFMEVCGGHTHTGSRTTCRSGWRWCTARVARCA
jgi:hydrogenase maturation factor